MIRRSSPSIRHWWSNYYRGSKEGEAGRLGYVMVGNGDDELEDAYQVSGMEWVTAALRTSKTLFNTLNTLGVSHAVGLTGEATMASQL